MTAIEFTIGDDTSANGNNLFQIKITTDLNLTGYTGRFQLGNVIKDFTDSIIVTKLININLSKEETSTFIKGCYTGAFKLFDTENKPITIIRDIKFIANSKVVENPTGG